MTTPDAHDHDDPFLWSRVVVRGPASAKFLQGQLSQDLAALGPAGEWSGLLTPTSDVLATCLVGRVDDGFELLVARALGDAALARLRRFHLRVDCTLTLEDADQGPFNTIGAQVEQFEPGPAEFLGLSPQCYGDAFVRRTVSFTKGCFTGQELVARLDARGSNVPWRFVHASGSTIEAIETALVASGPHSDASVSGVTTAVRAESGVAALGFVHRSALDALASHGPDVTITVID
jgi:folate-binding Fe-S cluster repair protein YgfZ